MRELRIWKGLTGKHDNILPCEGFTVFGELLCFVSKWMANGDIRAYLSKYPNANKAFIVRHLACIVELTVIVDLLGSRSGKRAELPSLSKYSSLRPEKR